MVRETTMVRVTCDACGESISLRGGFGECPAPSEVTARLVGTGWACEPSPDGSFSMSDLCARCAPQANEEGK